MSIVVEDYHKNYGQTIAVAGISFTVDQGEILVLPFQFVVAVDAGETKEHEGHHRVARRSGVVVELLAPDDEAMVIHEVGATLLVPEAVGGRGDLPRLLEPREVARRPVQLDQAVRDVGVVLQVAVDLGGAVPVRPVEEPLGPGLRTPSPCPGPGT